MSTVHPPWRTQAMTNPSHQTTVTAKSSDLPVTLGEAKDHLRILDEDHDAEVLAVLEAAVDVCEVDCGRSLRVSHTLTQKYGGWPCSPVRFDMQPVTAISSVTYYDADGATQTVSASDYRLLTSSNAGAVLEFDADFAKPALDARADAVTVAYTAGYAALADVPARAKQAVKLKLSELYGDLDDRMTESTRRAYGDLIGSLSWGCYR